MTTTGSLILDGKVVDAKGDGVFIHAIQGMRPDTVSLVPWARCEGGMMADDC